MSARGEYAVRAAVGLAAAYPRTVSAQALADEQHLPYKFLEAVLADLRRAGLVRSVRGAEGGYQLARPPGEIVVGSVLRAVEGPLAGVRGQRPESVRYEGNAVHLTDLWIAVRSALRSVVDEVSLEHLLSGRLPNPVKQLIEVPDAWQTR